MTGKSNGSHNLETDWARAPPPPGSAWERFCKALYNPEDNSCLGRTPQRWVIVLIFYAIFYAVLAAMFATCMAGLFYTLDENKPAFILSSSLIGENPGVSYRPIPENGFILSYHASNISESHPIVAQLEDFLQPYKADPLFTAKGCSSEDNYGFPHTPCFFIKVNKIYGWVPDFYEPSALPADMPEDLKEYIGKQPAEEQRQVWVSCWEENDGNTTFEYPWGQGLPESYFPYVNTVGYKTPLVAVKMDTEAKKLITVRCRAWAKNIVYNKSIKEPRGYARIQFFADQEDAAEDAAEDVAEDAAEDAGVDS